MTARYHVLGAVLALIGHLVGVIGLPLPVPPRSAPAPFASAKVSKKCCCAVRRRLRAVLLLLR